MAVRVLLRDEREELVVLAKACGETFGRVGAYLGVSPARAQQIYQLAYKRIATRRRLLHVKVISLPIESVADDTDASPDDPDKGATSSCVASG